MELFTGVVQKIFCIVIVAIAVGLIGAMQGTQDEREYWCNYTHELHADYEKCLERPDYKKKGAK